uniref:At3g61010 n=1 Tax=Arabidopsis thaliana TaxID=3702 RepID=Q6NLB2_ARATH|nr:At3g61010 [Arabidopsis thaliana]AAS92338.1 At3g61010 [Arabidopsis thaliana]
MLLYLLKRNNVSAAMFAPGWVYETAQQPNFNSAQNKWWSLVEKSCGIVQTIHKSSLFTRISIRALVTMFHSKVSNSQIVAFSFILHRCPMVQHFCQSLQRGVQCLLCLPCPRCLHRERQCRLERFHQS